MLPTVLFWIYQIFEYQPLSLSPLHTHSHITFTFLFITHNHVGADPTATLQRFAEKAGWVPGERLHIVSLGQGQGPIAEMLINQACKSGDWVCLQNCHLASSWMLRLEALVEELGREGKAHEDFRLWLSSMPSPAFPVLVLQNGIKLTTEPPKGVKANVKRTFNDTTEEVFEGSSKPLPWKKLSFALAFFHAVI